MIVKSRFVTIVVCAALLVLSLAFAFRNSGRISSNVSGQSSRGDKSPAKDASADEQWEYLVVSGGNLNTSSVSGEQFSGMRKQSDGAFSREAFVLERSMDKLGARGWELISVHGTQSDPVYYFKRPKENR